MITQKAKSEDISKSLTNYYVALSAKQSALMSIALQDHNVPFRIEHSKSDQHGSSDKIFVEQTDDEWLQNEIAALDLALEKANDADLLKRFDDALKAAEPNFQ